MEWHLEWKTGLVFGLEYEEVLVMDDEDEKDGGAVVDCINLHLGPATISVMY
jgi:hypothetical protein